MKTWPRLLTLIAAAFFVTYIFFAQYFPAGLAEVKQNIVSLSLGKVTSEQFTQFRHDEGYQAFPLAERIKSWLPQNIIYSNDWHRLPNLILALVCIAIFYKLTKNINVAVVMLAITPWFVWATVFDFSAMLTLALLLGAFAVKQKAIQVALLVLTSFVSLFGLIAVVLYSLLKIKDKVYLLALALIVVGIFLRWPLTQFKPQTFFAEDDYSIARASFEVDQRVREETKINNYQDVIPLKIKRISYNKYFFWLSRIAPQFVKVLNLEYVASPAQIRTTVAKNLWGEKRIPLIFFWQIPLIFLGLVYFAKVDTNLKPIVITLAIAGIAATGLAPAAKLESNGLGLVIPAAILATLGWQMLSKFRLLQAIYVVVAVVGIASTYHHFLNHELHWRDNKPFVFTTLVNEINRFQDVDQVTVTNMLGPTNFYYSWMRHTDLQEFWDNYNPTPQLGHVSFRHFDLKTEVPIANTGYIGLPGEFVGSKLRNNNNDFSVYELPANLQVIYSTPTKDSVSFGNGNFIWTVKAL